MTLFWLSLLLLLLIFSMDQLINKMYRYEKKPHRVTPEKHDIDFEEILIPINKNSQLYGWW
ncbi:MAG: hypothetical protein J7L35_05825, partial [Anaerolineales bacterium]|nr:hypothetical protein [Anaerolineales bacterium]